MTSHGSKRPHEDDDIDASRPRKRPGGASRVSRIGSEAVRQRQQQRAEEARQAATTRGVEEVVRQHYNAVPQRGRDWRKTDSRIKGLRSFNNWVKSTIIHKFSPAEAETEPYPLRVLDIGCGKGGDLGKWQQVPQPLELYVGVDPAEVSIEQARERYAQMRSGGGRGARGGRGGYHGGRPQRTFDAEFFAEDAFAYSLGDIPLIREVGFGPGTRWGPAGGFDVVSMMFCMHYAFESEVKAKGMLANVAGSLKKGGRFIGVIPNSDVIRSGVEAFHARQVKSATGNPQGESNGSPGGTEKNKAHTGSESPPYIIGEQGKSAPIEPISNDLVDVENSTSHTEAPNVSDAAPGIIPAINVLTEPASEVNGISAKPKPGILTINGAPQGPSPQEADNKDDRPAAPAVAEWGNSIYRVRFPGDTPKDGIFRPPYGWKYSFFMEEAVEEVPEYVVPWEAFRAYVSLFGFIPKTRLI